MTGSETINGRQVGRRPDARAVNRYRLVVRGDIRRLDAAVFDGVEIKASDEAHATLVQIGDQSEMVALFGRLVNLDLTLVTITLIDS